MSEGKHEAKKEPSLLDKAGKSISSYANKQATAFKQESSALAQKSKNEILTGKRYPDEAEPLDKKILAPIYMIRNLIRGALMNPLYRVGEILKPTVQTLESGIGIFTNPIFSPIKTLFHPIDYIKKNWIGTATGAVNATTNLIKAPVILANEAYKTAIDNNVEILAQSTENIPIIKQITSTSSRVSKALGWITKGPAKALDYLTSPVDVSNAWAHAA